MCDIDDHCLTCKKCETDEYEPKEVGMRYKCRTHGELDITKKIGCPECIEEMKAEIKIYRSLLAYAVDHRIDAKWLKKARKSLSKGWL